MNLQWCVLLYNLSSTGLRLATNPHCWFHRNNQLICHPRYQIKCWTIVATSLNSLPMPNSNPQCKRLAKNSSTGPHCSAHYLPAGRSITTCYTQWLIYFLKQPYNIFMPHVFMRYFWSIHLFDYTKVEKICQ